MLATTYDMSVTFYSGSARACTYNLEMCTAAAACTGVRGDVEGGEHSMQLGTCVRAWIWSVCMGCVCVCVVLA
jgi:hypothetical protein